jgi:hypothetical protein
MSHSMSLPRLFDRHWEEKNRVSWSKDRLTELLGNGVGPAPIDPAVGTAGITKLKDCTGEVNTDGTVQSLPGLDKSVSNFLCAPSLRFNIYVCVCVCVCVCVPCIPIKRQLRTIFCMPAYIAAF